MDKKVTGFYVRPLTARGDKMLGAKLEITVKGARGAPITSTTSKTSGEAYFPLSGSIKAGDTIVVKVDGKEGITETIPAVHPTQAQPTLEFKVGGSASAPKAEEHHEEHKDAHHEESHAPHRSENALVLNIVDSKSADIYSAVVHVKEFPDEVYTYGEKDEEIVINDPFGKPVTLLITAPGFKGATVKLDPRERHKLITLESDAKKAAPINWQKIIVFAVVLVAMIAIAYASTLTGGATQGLLAGTNVMTDPIVQSIMRYSTIVALIIVVIGRARLGQWNDIVSAGVFLLASVLSGWLSSLNALDQNVMAVIPGDAAKVIEFLRVARWVVYFLALGWMYWAAWSNTPDLSMPGAICDTLSLIIFTTGYRMGLPGEATISQINLVMLLKVIAAAHYLADMFQVPQMIMRKEVKTRLDPLIFSLLTIVFFVIVMFFVQPGLALFFVALCMGLLSEMMEEITKNYEPDKAPLQLGKMIQFVKTNKADGVLLASSIITFLSWTGLWTVFTKLP